MYRLIYKSRSSVEIVQSTIKGILKDSYYSNDENAVTGALLATSTHFLQVLEGDFKTVNETFYSIAKDSRHEELELIHFGPTDRRLFEGWSMKGFGLLDMNVELEARLKIKYGEEGGCICFPTEEWAVLSLMHDIKAIEGK